MERTDPARMFPQEDQGVADDAPGTAVAPPSVMLSLFLDLRIPFVGLVGGLALLAALRNPGDAAVADDGRAAGTVAGVVLDGHGDPVPGALVLVVDEAGRAVAEGQTATGGGAGGALGEFRINGLPAGEYGLRAVVPESESVASISRVPVRPWEDTRVQIRMDLGY